MRGMLLVFEVAMALSLGVSAVLLYRTCQGLMNVDPGFDPRQVLTFEIALSQAKYQDKQQQAMLYRNVLLKLRSINGIEQAGVVTSIPMDGSTESSMIRIPEHPPADSREKPMASYTVASPGYLPAIGTPLLQGRDFAEADALDSQPVAIVSQTMAKKFWPGEDALGKTVALGSPRYPTMTIVGIVADVKRLSLREEPGPEMYVPYTQKVYPSMLTMHVVVRTHADPILMAAAIRSALLSVDADLPMAKLSPMTIMVQGALAKPRFSMLLLGAFSLIALLLACTGVYAAITSSIQEREQEIGIRMALGAQRSQIFHLILGYGAKLALGGIGIGLFLAFIEGRLMSRFLYGVKPTDPLTLAGVSLFLVLVTSLACFFPARRAMRIDPLEALRYR